jgi:hypothetical protein
LDAVFTDLPLHVQDGNTATQDRATENAINLTSGPASKLNEALSGMPAEQQKAISQLYLFLVQVGIFFTETPTTCR